MENMENLCFSVQVKYVKLHNLPFLVMLCDEFKCDFHYYANGPWKFYESSRFCENPVTLYRDFLEWYF